MRQLHTSFLSAAMVVAVCSSPSFADTPPPAEPTTTWECQQADGTSIYTNKEKAGCRPMTLKPLSIVPNLEHMPTIPQASVSVPHYQAPPLAPATGRRSVPDWGQNWRASIAPSGEPAQEEVCNLYSEWIALVQKTRGGFYFGSDPSYGGDVTGRNLRTPSFSFYDNARYIALSRFFGTGFVPVGCQ